jgi:hypothetical protein
MIDGHAQVLAILEHVAREPGPLRHDPPAGDPRPQEERHAGPPMVGPQRAVLAGVAPELRDDGDGDVNAPGPCMTSAQNAPSVPAKSVMSSCICPVVEPGWRVSQPPISGGLPRPRSP